MNRREFLQSLAALGGATLINLEALAAAPEALIETQWAAAVIEPTTFYVSSYGSLATSVGYDYPASRRELYYLNAPGGSVDELIDAARNECQFENVVYHEYENAMIDAGINEPDGDWQAWLGTADDDTLSSVQRAIEQWLDGFGDEDYEYADLHGQSGQGEALSFFRNECETADLFGIVIVDGDHPGSSYFAAELHMDLDEANALAEQHGLPIRFAAGEV